MDEGSKYVLKGIGLAGIIGGVLSLVGFAVGQLSYNAGKINVRNSISQTAVSREISDINDDGVKDRVVSYGKGSKLYLISQPDGSFISEHQYRMKMNKELEDQTSAELKKFYNNLKAVDEKLNALEDMVEETK